MGFQTSCHYRRSSLPSSFGLAISSVVRRLLSLDGSLLGTSHGIGGVSQQGQTSKRQAGRQAALYNSAALKAFLGS